MTHFFKTLTGPLHNVQRALESLIEKTQDYAHSTHTPDIIKLLVEQQYVAKIIGVGNPSVALKAGT